MWLEYVLLGFHSGSHFQVLQQHSEVSDSSSPQNTCTVSVCILSIMVVISQDFKHILPGTNVSHQKALHTLLDHLGVFSYGLSSQYFT